MGKTTENVRGGSGLETTVETNNELLEEAKQRVYELAMDMGVMTLTDGSTYCRCCRLSFSSYGRLAKAFEYHTSQCSFRRLAEFTIKLAKQAEPTKPIKQGISDG